MEEIKRNCELCNGDASLYCPSDNAFLCYTCDSKVHCANFLVARHLRSVICPSCRILDGNRFSGAGIPPPSTFFCRNCSPPVEGSGDGGVDDDDGSLSSCSSCVSSTGEAGDEVETTSSSRKRRERVGVRRRENGTVVMDLKVEGVLVNWCRRMGVEDRDIGQVVSMAVELLSGCLDRITVLPFRVTLAASFWVAVRVCCRRGGVHCTSTCQDLSRMEQISGVPGKLILATEAKLARVIKRRRSREDHEEGWAEC